MQMSLLWDTWTRCSLLLFPSISFFCLVKTTENRKAAQRSFDQIIRRWTVNQLQVICGLWGCFSLFYIIIRESDDVSSSVSFSVLTIKRTQCTICRFFTKSRTLFVSSAVYINAGGHKLKVTWTGFFSFADVSTTRIEFLETVAV